MPIAVPQTISKAWGDEVVAEFVPWLDERLQEALKEKTVARDEYRQVLSRLDMLDKSVSLINEGLMQTRAEFREDQVQMRAEFREDQAQMQAELGELRRNTNEHFDKINERFDRMESRMGERFDTMYDRMLVQSRWLVGSIALFGTVISILLAIGQFIK